MTSKTLKIWLGSALLASVAIAPFLARGDQSLTRQKQENALLISTMSESQLARLRQNEAMFKAASPETQKAVRALHEALVKDHATGGKELTTVMQKYDAWLKTIDPIQRSELEKTQNPRDRIDLMRMILKQQQDVSLRWMNGGPGGDRRRWNSHPPILSEKSFRKIMAALEEAAQNRLSDSEREQLQHLQGVRRDFQLLRILKNSGTGVNPKPLLEEVPEEFKIVAGNIDQYVEEERIRDVVHGQWAPPDAPKQEEGGPPPPPPGDVLTMLVLDSFRSEVGKQWREARQQIDSKKLETFLDTLPIEKQHELLALEAPEFQNELKNLYLESIGMNDLPTFQAMGEIMGRRGGPPFGFGGPRENRPGRGPGRDGPFPGAEFPPGQPGRSRDQNRPQSAPQQPTKPKSPPPI